MGPSPLSNYPHLHLKLLLCVKQEQFPVLALIDSGAEQNLSSPEFVKELIIPTTDQANPLKVSALVCSASETVLLETHLLHFIPSGNITKSCLFLCFPIKCPT
ncbi:hypothetical protein ATANTOWER_025577 [Ataeniobius toweri]|uniref:Uncharacterized protein n=1 Tax=Ataeniobius toweri TaxID=208326 RepID=A0ABU7AGZ9_9TELE|nr:hypothetical protein [Ataeniobius toweri]